MNIKNFKIIILLLIGIISITASLILVEDITQSILTQFEEAVDIVPFFIPTLYFLNFLQISVYIFGTLTLIFFLLLKLNKEQK